MLAQHLDHLGERLQVGVVQWPAREGHAAADRRDAFLVEPGMRIAQLVVLPVPELDVDEVDALPESERGERGFGSSAA